MNTKPTFVAEGIDAPRDDFPTVERDAITAVVRNPKTGEYLGLRWKQVDWETLITGGIEEGQTAEDAARAEVLQETGYDNLKLVAELPRYDAKFFHHPKGVNRFAHFQCFLFEIEGGDSHPISNEEKEKHEHVWLSDSELKSFRLPEGHRFLINHILDSGL